MRVLTLSIFAAILSAPAFAADLGTYRPGTPYNNIAGGTMLNGLLKLLGFASFYHLSPRPLHRLYPSRGRIFLQRLMLRASQQGERIQSAWGRLPRRKPIQRGLGNRHLDAALCVRPRHSASRRKQLRQDLLRI